jgi:hypothetical protein
MPGKGGSRGAYGSFAEVCAQVNDEERTMKIGRRVTIGMLKAMPGKWSVAANWRLLESQNAGTPIEPGAIHA